MKEEKKIDKSVCKICGREIRISIRKNTGICCGNCEKIEWDLRDGHE